MNLFPHIFIIFVLNTSVWAFELSCNGRSILNQPIERIFSRKKRFLLLPTGASLKITVALGKAIISKVPRGLNLSIELSSYYPVPTTVEDWYIKKWKTKTTPRPKPKDTFISVPGTNIRYPAKTATKKPPVFLRPQPLDPIPYAPAYKDLPFYSPWVSIFRKSDENQIYPDEYVTSKHNNISTAPIWQNYFNTYPNRWNVKSMTSTIKPNKFHKYNNYDNSNWYKNKNSWSYPNSKQKNIHSTIPESYFDVNLRDFKKSFGDMENWEQYRGHRDRRGIFDHLESFSSLIGFDVKKCILRTICETKQYLLPPGYSLIQDVIRVVFSIPKMDGMSDEYINAMGREDCVQLFRKDCAFSLINYVLT